MLQGNGTVSLNYFKRSGLQSGAHEEKNCGTDVMRFLNVCYVFTLGQFQDVFFFPSLVVLLTFV